MPAPVQFQARVRVRAQVKHLVHPPRVRRQAHRIPTRVPPQVISPLAGLPRLGTRQTAFQIAPLVRAMIGLRPSHCQSVRIHPRVDRGPHHHPRRMRLPGRPLLLLPRSRLLRACVLPVHIRSLVRSHHLRVLRPHHDPRHLPTTPHHHHDPRRFPRPMRLRPLL